MTDAQLVEIELTPQEKEALAMRHPAQGEAATYHIIAAKVFDGKLTRQGVYELVKQAERKQWRLNAKQRYEGHLEDCPIDELPVPARVRNALMAAGYEKLGQIAGMSRADFQGVEGIGRRQGSFLLHSLLREWGVSKPKSFCPNCGAALRKKLKEGKDGVSCKRCGTTSFLRSVEPITAVSATA